MIVTYRNIADDPERIAALDRNLAALAAGYDRGPGPSSWTGNTSC
jgi:hypothetical protein